MDPQSPDDVGFSPDISRPSARPILPLYRIPSEPPPLINPGFTVQDFVPTETHRWWVLHCRPQSEKMLAWQMHGQGIGYFLPLERSERRYAKDRHVTYKPVFPRYIFMFGDYDELFTVKSMRSVDGAVEVKDQYKLRSELSNLEPAFRSPAEIDRYAWATDGVECEIMSGPLRGCRGAVLGRDRKRRVLLLQVTILGQSVGVDLSEDIEVEPLS